jgi:hypothetical protein
MTAVGLLSLVAGIGWSTLEFAKAVDNQLQIETLAKQASFYEQRYARGKEQLPDLPADGRNIQRAVATVGTIGSYRSSPLRMLSTLSEGLEGFPDLVIGSIEWEAGSDPSGAQAAAARDNRRSRRAPRAPDPDETVPYFQIARLSGRIEPFDGDYREALDRVNRFANTLGGLPGVESVNVLKLPLDISSRQRLSGIASGAVSPGTASFELRVVLRTHGDTG